MDKLKKKLPRFVQEIIVTAISSVGLWALWSFAIKEFTFSDQALSTIGLALSTSAGVLTAIVVSFVLITWQSSRRERSSSFWRWRNVLHQLVDSFDANLEVLWEIREEVLELTQASSEVALLAPMPRDKFKQLSSKVSDKATKVAEKLQYVNELAEGVRDVANRMEKEVLYAYRDLAIELGAIYDQIRGSRKWKKG